MSATDHRSSALIPAHLIMDFHVPLLVELISDKKNSLGSIRLSITFYHHLLYQGFAATRLFVKKSCIVHKMSKDAMPSIQALDALVKEKKVKINLYTLSHRKYLQL